MVWATGLLIAERWPFKEKERIDCRYPPAPKGIALEALGRCDDAIAELHRAEALGPAHADTRGHIVRNRALEMFYWCPERMDLDAAFEHAQFAFRTEEDEPDALGAVLLRRGDYAEAKRSGDGWVRAMSAWHLGERKEARRLLAEWVKWQENNRPDSPTAIRMREEAERLFGIRPTR